MASEQSIGLVRRSSIEHQAAIKDDDELSEFDFALPTKQETHKASAGLIALAFLITILGFTIQVEAIAYYEDVLGWSKPFSGLYVTHSSLCLPWICHVLYRRIKDRNISLKTFALRYTQELLDAVASVEAARHASGPTELLWYLLRSMLVVTIVLTVSGVSWFAALAYTTPGDLTAIYNCSVFFAAVFAVPILHQRLRWTSIAAVAISIAGTFIIAYGDVSTTSVTREEDDKVGAYRVFGNLIAAAGAVAFGLYSVLFKHWTLQSPTATKGSSSILTFGASALTGFYTLLIGWIVIVALHILDIEPFEFPSFEVIFYLALSVIAGAVSMTLLLVLVTWTNPVFGNVSSILSVFFVAIADWMLFGLTPSAAVYLGGSMIFLAFGLLARDELVG